ncbi:MAG: ABC transporter arginine-binding protein 1 [Chlamydiales bacterium]|nr:ABC transporter arginine-binding protein 1 [Chlamydiales bacterium]
MAKKLLLTIALFTHYVAAPCNEKLIVGTNTEFPPFSYLEKGKIVGFDIDIAKNVAQKLGKKIEFKDMPFEALIPDLMLNHVDLVASGMTYTKERAKRVSFTQPYHLDDPLVILTLEPQKIHSLDALKGKKVVVIEGFTAESFLSSQKGIKLISLPTQADGFIALKSRRADAFVTARSTVRTFLATHNTNVLYTETIEGTAETCSLVLPKNKPLMLREVQKALDEMEAEGTIHALKDKWGLL